MSTHGAEVLWLRGEQPFLDHRYSRRHRLRFDGGLEIAGSSSPAIVPVPASDPVAVDPEEAFVAALASCHMLWFLDLAARRGFTVDRYRDDAVGTMGRNALGQLAITVVTLRPEVECSGAMRPTPAHIESLHHAAHDACFLARSVRCEVRCEPVHSGVGAAGGTPGATMHG